MENKKYTCDICGLEFESDWSEEDAFKEYEELFGIHEKTIMVCDDCHKYLMETFNCTKTASVIACSTIRKSDIEYAMRSMVKSYLENQGEENG